MSANIRTFRAADARAALAAVKAALGPDAVILSTREVGNGLFRPAEIEVTAALPEPVAAPPRPAAVANNYTALAATGAYARGAKPAAASVPAPPAIPPVEQHELPSPRGIARPAAVEPQTPREELPSPRGINNPPGLRRVSRDEDPLAHEMHRLRSAMEDVRRQLKGAAQGRPEEAAGLTPAAVELYAHLCNRGVEESIAEDAVRQASTAAGNNGSALLNAVRDALAERIVGARAPWLPDRRRLVAMVGPTGVGKTTTLAKIAARALLESKQKVALITLDTYRIGASEQIARYGEIMNVPSYVAKDRNELTRAIDRCASADLVLIDTAGRSMSEAIARQAELLRSVPSVQLYLVLSAATGSREMAAAAERYRGLSPERLIVTKVDEAVGVGSMLSASVRVARPVCAIADGQRVPEDLHAMTTAQLVDLVIGSWTGSSSSSKAAIAAAR